MDALKNDLRLALRGLRRTPGFTAAAVITLALGIGATTALFSVVDAVLLRPLGFGDESRLAALSVDFPGMHLQTFALSIAELKDLEGSPIFEHVGGYDPGTGALLTSGNAERVRIANVTTGFFPALGVQPLLGRNWTAEEDKRGAAKVVVLSYSAYRNRYASSPSIVGSDIVLDGASRRVIGVLPERFSYDRPTEFWVPFDIPPDWEAQRGAHYLQGVGRLRPGVTLEAARRTLADLSKLAVQNHPAQYPPEHGLAFRLIPLRDRFVGSARETLLLLLGAVFLVLLIACANVASLLLARSAARQGEIAVRAALGAARGRLLRQLLTESALLAGMGAVLGVLTAQWALSGLLLAAPRNIRQMAAVTLDLRILAFSLCVAVLCTLVFGLFPALRASRADLASALKDGSRSVAGGNRLRSVLVTGQFALSVALLASAALVLRSFAKLLHVNPGFDPAGVVEVRAEPGGAAFDDDPTRQRYFERAFEALSALPSVQSIGGIDRLPNEGSYQLSYFIEGYTPAAGENQPTDFIRRAWPGNFRTLRQPVVEGREFTASDDAKAPPVALVNEAWVRRYFPGKSVLGKRIRLDTRTSDGIFRTIVGVVGDARESGVDRPVQPVYYFASAQMPPDRMTFVLRSDNAKALIPRAREALARVDRNQPAGDVTLLEESLANSLATRRFPLQLLGCFALLALLLSAVGIYGVTAYSVAQRTRELGVRMAIGATSLSLVRMVLGRALVLALAGIGAGIVAALASAQLLSSLLVEGTSPRDPLIYLAVACVLAVVALLASALPALRAARIEPMAALRTE
ncbi:MAG TPA: ABC transporter permease [Myxococcales bacterium]|jgi:predicted permease